MVLGVDSRLDYGACVYSISTPVRSWYSILSLMGSSYDVYGLPVTGLPCC
ncbi:hypothetical protein ACNKHP_23910 [Shigella boydii]